ncbi:MAG: hypothetical protein U0905_07370 [Pirellulales bacterium]
MNPPAPQPKQPQVPSAWSQVVDSRATIFLLLFLVMAVLGLPLLWASPKFSTLEKWVWSVVVTLYTALLIGITVGICWWSWNIVTSHL